MSLELPNESLTWQLHSFTNSCTYTPTVKCCHCNTWEQLHPTYLLSTLQSNIRAAALQGIFLCAACICVTCTARLAAGADHLIPGALEISVAPQKHSCIATRRLLDPLLYRTVARLMVHQKRPARSNWVTHSHRRVLTGCPTVSSCS